MRINDPSLLCIFLPECCNDVGPRHNLTCSTSCHLLSSLPPSIPKHGTTHDRHWTAHLVCLGRGPYVSQSSQQNDTSADRPVSFSLSENEKYVFSSTFTSSSLQCQTPQRQMYSHSALVRIYSLTFIDYQGWNCKESLRSPNKILLFYR